jgi:MFS family permease
VDLTRKLTFVYLTGMGTGFMFISSVTAVSRWFDKKRALATGLAVSGAGFGIFLCAPLVRLLLTLYGHEGALLLEGGLALQGCVFALLLRPIPNRSRRSVRSQVWLFELCYYFTDHQTMQVEQILTIPYHTIPYHTIPYHTIP